MESSEGHAQIRTIEAGRSWHIRKNVIQELKTLESLSVISRKAYPEIPPKVEYSLTPRGRTLIPLIESVVDWGNADIKEHDITVNIVEEVN